MAEEQEMVSVGWDHVKVPKNTSDLLDVALVALANSWGVFLSDRVQKFVTDDRDEIGTFMDGFGSDKET